MSTGKLVMMANQIGSFFASQQGDAPTQIAQHLEQFWEPRMRTEIIAHLAAGGAGLDAPVRAAIARLRPPKPRGPAADQPG